jgi:DNA-binding NarL/FixJ family response regulator
MHPLTRATVGIVEDHKLILEFLCKVCRQNRKLSVICEITTGAEAVRQISCSRPDVVLIDLSLPDIDGFNVISRIRALGCHPRFIIISSHLGPYIIYRVEALGVYGFLDKATAKTAFIAKAIESTIVGEVFFSSSYLAEKERFAKDALAIDKILSAKQLEILPLLARFDADEKISQYLSIAPRTVETHRTVMMKKLNLHTRAELIQFATAQGCI